MELKYYLRGIGLGIIVTAVIMGFALSNEPTMTDRQIRERARELGMIENTVLAGEPKEDTETEDDVKDNSEENVSVEILESDQEATDKEDIDRIEQIRAAADAAGRGANSDNTDSDTENADAEAEDASSSAKSMISSIENMESDVAFGTDPVEEETKAVEENVPASSGRFTVTINSGDGSDTASRKLASAGVVSSASSFDDFLCANGYDKRIRPGTYSIPANASNEQIARIITGQE